MSVRPKRITTMRFISLALAPLMGCVFVGSGEVKVDTADPNGGTPNDTSDTAANPSDGIPMSATEILEVIESPSSYLGHDVAVIDGQLVLVGDPINDQVLGFSVNSTQSPRSVFLPTDTADFYYTASTSGVAAGYRIYQTVTDTGPGGVSLTCFSQDYDDTLATDGGALVCFRSSDLTSGVSIDDTSAVWHAYYENTYAYAGSGLVTGDFDGDSKTDIVLGGGEDGVFTVDWDAFAGVPTTSIPIVKNYPSGGDTTFIGCDKDNDGVNDGSAWCQAEYYNQMTHSLIIADSNYSADRTGVLLESYTLTTSTALPLVETGQLTTPMASGVWGAEQVHYVPDYDYLVISIPEGDEWEFLNPVTLAVEWTVATSVDCAPFGANTTELNGTPYLALGCTGEENKGVETGNVYLFDITSSMPTDIADYTSTAYNYDAEHGGMDIAFGNAVDGGSIMAVGNQSYLSSTGVTGDHGMTVYDIHN